MTKEIEGLTKCAHEKNARISKITNKMDNMIERRSSLESLKLPRIQDEGVLHKENMIKKIHLSAGGLILIDQLENFIIKVFKDKFESSSKFSATYAKLYTQRIDNLKMPEGYQPSKLQQFDGKGNIKTHIEHFIKTCNDVGMYVMVIMSLNSFFDLSKNMSFTGAHISNQIL